jgi:hypothetical protein
MEQLNIFVAVLALTLVAFSSAVARADKDSSGLEGLDVTMIVLDDTVDLEGSVNEMDGPDDDVRNDHNEGDSEYENDPENQFADESDDGVKEGFEGDDYIKNEDEMGEEGSFEDGEHVDEDEFDEDEDNSVD